jgi:hypothetical protein
MYLDGVDEERWHDLAAVRAHAGYLAAIGRQSH